MTSPSRRHGLREDGVEFNTGLSLVSRRARLTGRHPHRFATSVAILVVALVSAAFFGFALSGLFFLGGCGVVYAMFLYGDLLQNMGPCAKCPPCLGGREVVESP